VCNGSNESCMRFLAGMLQNPHGAIRAVHFDGLTILQAAGRVVQPGDARNAVLSRHDRAMLQRAAHLQGDAACIDEQRRPARDGGPGDQDFAGKQFLFGGVAEHLDPPLDQAGGDRHADQYFVGAGPAGREENSSARINDLLGHVEPPG